MNVEIVAICRFKTGMEVCLISISGYQVLKQKVYKAQHTKYDMESMNHENKVTIARLLSSLPEELHNCAADSTYLELPYD